MKINRDDSLPSFVMNRHEQGAQAHDSNPRNLGDFDKFIIIFKLYHDYMGWKRQLNNQVALIKSKTTTWLN